MSVSNYTLEVISHLPQFKNKSLRKYYVDGIDTVGAWGNEPFEIRFKNNTWQKIQVKISLDGTDVFTGEPATTEPTKNMWVVEGYGTLSLKAWPETNNGGAAFIFTSADNSVAVHTHGDLSSRGIIAAAVYTEGHVEPIKINQPIHHYHHYDYWYNPNIWTYPYTICSDNITFGSSGTTLTGSNVSFNSSGTFSTNSVSSNVRSKSLQSTDQNTTKEATLEELVSVGAGEYVDQKISYTTGLIKPTFAETIRVRYVWYDDLVSKLKETSAPAPHASGFPGDKNHVNINLGKTPRQGSFRRVETNEQVFARF